MVHQLRRRIVLPISPEEGWDFFSDPRNLSRITPPELGMRIRSDPPPEMYPGMLITYTVQPLLGIPLNWVSEITHVDRLRYFVDEQRVGPYRLWHHQHRFRACENGLEVEDWVDYLLPLGPFGRLVENLLVRAKLEAIFNYRSQALRKLFGEVSDDFGTEQSEKSVRL